MIEEEISLKELILILLKEWKTILMITFIGFLFSIALIFLFNETSYTTTLEGSISTIDRYDTTYGVYSSNITKIDEQINLINNHEYIDYLNTLEVKSINVNPKVINGSDFTIQIQSNEESMTKTAANEIAKSFELYLNYNLQSKALSHFLTLNEINVVKLKESSQYTQELIKTFSAKLEGVQSLLEVSIINPTYQIIQSEITHLELAELTNTNEIRRLEKSIEKLSGQQSESFEDYLESNDRFDQVTVSLLFSDKSLTQSTKRFEPLTTTAIATVLSIMLGVFVALFKNYWNNN